jgi:2-polyprenyl-6-methoxyphenol hydroxylase-like FAD-dependent oxidoreductase
MRFRNWERVCVAAGAKNGSAERRICRTFVRKPYGPGWALVGDAGCHKDPYMALGMCDAFRDVDYLVAALEAGFSEDGDTAAELARYERRRNDAMRDEDWQNLAGARFEKPPAELLRIRAALRGNPDATRQWFLAREKMIPSMAE